MHALPPATSFMDFSSVNASRSGVLMQLYGTIDRVEGFVGAFAERANVGHSLNEIVFANAMRFVARCVNAQFISFFFFLNFFLTGFFFFAQQ